MSIRTNIILAITISFLLLLAQTGYWYNHYIVDPANFKQVFTTAVRNDESRVALSNEIVVRGLQNRPVLMRLFGEPAQSMVYSLLGTEFFRSRYDSLVERAHARVTTDQTQDIVISLEELKAVTLPLLERLNPEGERRVDPRQLPDEIVLVQQEQIPSIAPYTRTILWLAWISFLTLIPLIIYYFYKTTNLPEKLKILGGTLAAVYLFILLAVASLQPVLLANIPSNNVRIIAENILESFLATYFRQLTLVIIGGMILLLIGYLLPKINVALRRNATQTKSTPSTQNEEKKR